MKSKTSNIVDVSQTNTNPTFKKSKHSLLDDPFYDMFLDKFLNSFNELGNITQSYPPVNIDRVEPEKDYSNGKTPETPYYRLEMAVAGFTKEDLTVLCNDSILTVKGNITESENSSENKMILRQIGKRKFERSFDFEAPIEVKHAKMENGMLILEVYNKAPPEGTVIEVE